MLDQPVDHGGGKPRHLGQQSVAAWGHAPVEVVRRAQAQRPRDRGGVDQVGRRQGGQCLQGVFWALLLAPAGEVVADHQLAFGVDAGDELFELQRKQPAVGAQFDDVVLDLAGDAGDHLQSLGDHGDVAYGHQVLDLQCGKRGGDLVQTQLVAFQRRQRLVGSRQDLTGVLQDVA